MSEETKWFDMRAGCKCAVHVSWCCIATWSHAGHVLGQQQHNKFAQSKHARRTARASSIDEKGLIIKSKATSAPPRAGTTGMKKKTHQSMPPSRSSCRPSTQNKQTRTSDDHSGVLIAAAEDIGILEVTWASVPFMKKATRVYDDWQGPQGSHWSPKSTPSSPSSYSMAKSSWYSMKFRAPLGRPSWLAGRPPDSTFGGSNTSRRWAGDARMRQFAWVLHRSKQVQTHVFHTSVHTAKYVIESRWRCDQPTSCLWSRPTFFDNLPMLIYANQAASLSVGVRVANHWDQSSAAHRRKRHLKEMDQRHRVRSTIAMGLAPVSVGWTNPKNPRGQNQRQN